MSSLYAIVTSERKIKCLSDQGEPDQERGKPRGC